MSMLVLDALGSKTHGYLARPATEGKLPAIIQLQVKRETQKSQGAEPED